MRADLLDPRLVESQPVGYGAIAAESAATPRVRLTHPTAGAAQSPLFQITARATK